MTVDSVDTSEFTEWLQARKDEAQKKKTSTAKSKKIA